MSGSRRRSSSERDGRGANAVLVALACGMPALAIGGVHGVTTMAFALVSVLALIATQIDPVRVPRGTIWLAIAAVFALIPTLPGSAVLAPTLTDVHASVAGGSHDSTRPLAVALPDARMDAVRVLGLLVLFVTARWVPWRVSAWAVSLTAAIVALVAFAQALTGARAIYGLYRPGETVLGRDGHFFGTFVNPNHQAALLVLGLGVALALAHDARRRARAASGHDRAMAQTDRTVLALGVAAVCGLALPFTLSRGGIVAANLLLVGLAVVWALADERSAGSSRSAARRRRGIRGRRVGIAVGVVIVSAAVSAVVARPQLETLAPLLAGDLSGEHKLQTLVEAEGMLALSPVFGIGAGAYAELSDLFAVSPGAVRASFVESAPLGLLLNYGVGGIFALFGLGVAAWFAARDTAHHRSTTARRMILVSLGALALTALLDHWWQFLGVSAPFVALLGALTPASARPLPRRRLVIAVSLVGVALLMPALSSAHLTYTARGRTYAEASAPEVLREQLVLRPLDAGLHRALARASLEAGDNDRALHHAKIATTLAPGNPEGWLALGGAHAAAGDDAATCEAAARALAATARSPSPGLVNLVVSACPSPARFAQVFARSSPQRDVVMRALMQPAPAHAAALAAAAIAAEPTAFEPHRISAELALASGELSRALDHARTLLRIAPGSSTAYRTAVKILRAFDPPREADVRLLLEAGLNDPALNDMRERGHLEELLVNTLARGTPADRERARAMLPQLLSRPASRDVRARRAKLRQRLEK